MKRGERKPTRRLWAVCYSEHPPLPRCRVPRHIPWDTVSKNTAQTRTWSFTACYLSGSDLLAEPPSDTWLLHSVVDFSLLSCWEVHATRCKEKCLTLHSRLSCTVSIELDHKTLLNLNARNAAGQIHVSKPGGSCTVTLCFTCVSKKVWKKGEKQSDCWRWKQNTQTYLFTSQSSDPSDGFQHLFPQNTVKTSRWFVDSTSVPSGQSALRDEKGSENLTQVR